MFGFCMCNFALSFVNDAPCVLIQNDMHKAVLHKCFIMLFKLTQNQWMRIDIIEYSIDDINVTI